MEEYRVCHITTVHPAFDIRIFHKECKSLVDAGYNVTLIVQNDKSETIEGIKIVALPKPKNRFMRASTLSAKALRIALDQKTDIYHIHDPELLFTGILLKVLTGKKVIYDAHEDLPSQIVSKHWIPFVFRGISSLLAWVLEGLAAPFFDAIICAGEDIYRRFSKLNRHALVIQNYPMINSLLPSPDFSVSRFKSGLIVNFGGIKSTRMARELVTAMDLLPPEIKARLILGGRVDPKELLQEIMTLPGWRHVQYVGSISYDETMSFLSRAAVSIVLYSPHPNHYSIRSNRFFESLAMGMPVITSNFPEWRKMIEEEKLGMVVNPQSPTDIATAIEYLCTHPEESLQMGQRGARLIRERLNWDNEKMKLLELYERLNQ